jgi:MSHA biogenesis protein MshJ
MKLSIKIVKEWIKKRNSKQRKQLFFLGFVIIYIICLGIFLKPIQNKAKMLRLNIQALQLQKDTLQQELNNLNQLVTTETFSKALREYKELSLELQQLQQKYAQIKPLLITPGDWAKLKEAIISQQNDMDKSITLVSLHDSSNVKWAPAGVDTADISYITQNNIYKQELEINFQSDYFSALTFLSRLESLPWPIYWDSLDYKVLTYPKADIVVKIHVLNEKKEEE